MKVYASIKPQAVVVARDEPHAQILARIALRQARRRVPKNLKLEEVNLQRASVIIPKGGAP